MERLTHGNNNSQSKWEAVSNKEGIVFNIRLKRQDSEEGDYWTIATPHKYFIAFAFQLHKILMSCGKQ